MVKDIAKYSAESLISLAKQVRDNCFGLSMTEEKLKIAILEEDKNVSETNDRLLSQAKENVSNTASEVFDEKIRDLKSIIAFLENDPVLSDFQKDLSLASEKDYPPEELDKVIQDKLKLIDSLLSALNAWDVSSLAPALKVSYDKKDPEKVLLSEVDKPENQEQFDFFRGEESFESAFYGEVSSETPPDHYSSFRLNQAIKNASSLRETLLDLWKACTEAVRLLSLSRERFLAQYDWDAYSSDLNEKRRQWIDALKAKAKTIASGIFQDCFCDGGSKTISASFLAELDEVSATHEPNPDTGSQEYQRAMRLGDIQIPISNVEAHIDYLKRSPLFSSRTVNGTLSCPMVLDLVNKGNILLSTKDSLLSESVKNLINETIVSFLLSFPPSRLHLCLVDVDNAMDFTRFSILTKINPNLLCGGIVRDDRKIEGTIKDMEETMFGVQDNILSRNGVSDIFEYNELFPANPQNIYLLVIINYPKGMRTDISSRIERIVSNGGMAGIYSLIVNNDTIQETSYYKKADHNAFLEHVKPKCLCIHESGDRFVLEYEHNPVFLPSSRNLMMHLPSIVDVLLNNMESAKQQVIPLDRMFDYVDEAVKKEKKTYAEVLSIPIGERGGEVQTMELTTTGDGSSHAVLIGGTGSGKSNLLHAIILDACYRYSPDELNIYLIDFKGGVEFKYYEANKIVDKQLPHIRLTGLTSDLEDGVAILDNLQKVLRQRETLFRQKGVEDIIHYTMQFGKIPRLFVIIDEIQELFERDEKLSQKAVEILRELFKKGRAFGINILWASQNVPKVPGLKDKILSQIGNRISLRLNNPEDALDIQIDSKAVVKLNRPEKGLGLINDIRYGNSSMEFRAAYAETSVKRERYSSIIREKWSPFMTADREPLFIVGNDDDPSPMVGGGLFCATPNRKGAVSKSESSYALELGKNYVTGSPFALDIAMRKRLSNVIMVGNDAEILRDLMGYSLLSVVCNMVDDLDVTSENPSIYCANGEMISTASSKDLFNALRSDIGDHIVNVSLKDLPDSIRKVYELFRERKKMAEESETIAAYHPVFFAIHALQRYRDCFAANQALDLGKDKEKEKPASLGGRNDAIASMLAGLERNGSPDAKGEEGKPKEVIFFSDAFKLLMKEAGNYGIHFIISLDNPAEFPSLKDSFRDCEYKIVTKGVNANIIGQMLEDYRFNVTSTNEKVAMAVRYDERQKLRIYRYDPDNEKNASWYQGLVDGINKEWN